MKQFYIGLAAGGAIVRVVLDWGWIAVPLAALIFLLARSLANALIVDPVAAVDRRTCGNRALRELYRRDTSEADGSRR